MIISNSDTLREYFRLCILLIEDLQYTYKIDTSLEEINLFTVLRDWLAENEEEKSIARHGRELTHIYKSLLFYYFSLTEDNAIASITKYHLGEDELNELNEKIKYIGKNLEKIGDDGYFSKADDKELKYNVVCGLEANRLLRKSREKFGNNFFFTLTNPEKWSAGVALFIKFFVGITLILFGYSIGK